MDLAHGGDSSMWKNVFTLQGEAMREVMDKLALCGERALLLKYFKGKDLTVVKQASVL